MSSNKQIKIKKCFVEYCGNTTEAHPNKIFVSVPNDGKLKRSWFEAVRRNAPAKIFSKTSYYCCEDHFNVSRYRLQNFSTSLYLF